MVIFEIITSMFNLQNQVVFIKSIRKGKKPPSFISYNQSFMEPPPSHQPAQQPAQVQQNKQSSEKTQQKIKKSKDHVEFWLTQAQMLVIQHHLPRLFSLIPVKSSSRLLAGSRILEKEKSDFVNRKRGRPEGSKSKSKKSVTERKSVRILSKQSQKDESSSSQSEQSQEEVSFARQIQFSKSISPYEMRSEKSTRRRQSVYNVPKQLEGSNDNFEHLREQFVNKTQILTKSATTQSEKKEASTGQPKKGQLIPLSIFSIDVPKRQIKNNTEEIKQFESIKELKLLDNSKVFEDQEKKMINPLKRDEKKVVKNDYVTGEDHLEQKNQKEYCSQELQSKFIQEKFSAQIQILKKLKEHEDIIPFLEPVDQKRDGAPKYYSIIDDPIDLQTIEFKLANNIYKEPSFFHSDIQKMWNNSKQYNRNNPNMLKITNRLEKFYFKFKKIASQKKEKMPTKK